MDKVTHFVFLLALILVIIVCSYTIFGINCSGSYIQSKKGLIRGAVDNVGGQLDDLKNQVQSTFNNRRFQSGF